MEKGSMYVMVYVFGRLLIRYSTLPLISSASPSLPTARFLFLYTVVVVLRCAHMWRGVLRALFRFVFSSGPASSPSHPARGVRLSQQHGGVIALYARMCVVICRCH